MKVINRIKKHSDFNKIISSGVKTKTSHFTVFYTNNEENLTRIGIAVGKKNGSAVQRVKIKRQVRAMLAKRNKYNLPIDLIIVVHPSYKIEEFNENELELNNNLDKIKEVKHWIRKLIRSFY